MEREEAESYLHKKVEAGELVSPVLPEGIKNYLIDIDGTICDDIPNEEPERMATAKLYPDALETSNKWYDEGHLLTKFRTWSYMCKGTNITIFMNHRFFNY